MKGWVLWRLYSQLTTSLHMEPQSCKFQIEKRQGPKPLDFSAWMDEKFDSTDNDDLIIMAILKKDKMNDEEKVLECSHVDKEYAQILQDPNNFYYVFLILEL